MSEPANATDPSGTTAEGASQDVLLEVARPDLYRRNAFRLMELPVEASSREIARRQLMSTQARNANLPIPAGPGRMLPLPEPTNPDTLSEAAERLSNPQRRLVDEFFWFWPEQPGQSRQDEALGALARNDLQAARSLWAAQGKHPSQASTAVHNLAVLAHAAALELEEKSFSQLLTLEEHAERNLRWENAFWLWKQVLEDEAGWSQVIARIRAMDDPRLTTGTARRLRAGLPLALLVINAHLALRAAERGATADARRQVGLMQKAGFEPSAVEEALHRAVDPTRQRVKTLCKNFGAQSDADPAQGVEVAKRLIQETKPLLAVLDSLLPTSDATRISMHDEVATRALACVISFGNKTEHYGPALPVFNDLLTIAVGEDTKTRIKDNRQAAETLKLRHTCWFCQERPPQAACKVEIPMYGDVRRTPTFVGGRYGTRVEWRKYTVEVPRCLECKAAQDQANRGGCLAVGLAILGAVLSLFGLFGVLASLGNSDGGGCLISLLIIGAGIFSLHLLDRRMKRRREELPAGIRPLSTKDEFPEVQRLKREGWKLGTGPATQ